MALVQPPLRRRAKLRLTGVLLGLMICSPLSEVSAPPAVTALLSVSRAASVPGAAVAPISDPRFPAVPRSAKHRAAAGARDVERLPYPLTSTSPPVGSRALENWRQWLRLIEARAYQQLPIVAADLAESLQAGANWEVYGDIESLLVDSHLAFEVRAQLVDLLGEIATPEALSILLKTASQGADSPLYAPALHNIAQIGDNHWGGRFHEELSPLLEDVWQTLGNADRPLLLAVGRAIVGIGAPSGITLMINTLLGANPTSQPKQDLRSKQLAAFTETPKVTNPAAVPVLREVLSSVAGGSGRTRRVSPSVPPLGSGGGLPEATPAGPAAVTRVDAPSTGDVAASPPTHPDPVVTPLLAATASPDASQPTATAGAATNLTGPVESSAPASASAAAVVPETPLVPMGSAESSPAGNPPAETVQSAALQDQLGGQDGGASGGKGAALDGSDRSPVEAVALDALQSIGTAEAHDALTDLGVMPPDGASHKQADPPPGDGVAKGF